MSESVRGRRDALILGAHAAALVAGLWFAWAQWSGVADAEAAARQGRLSLQELDRRLQMPGAGGSIPSALADPLLVGETAALAGASLQDRVVSAIRAAGGTVTSSQVEAGARDETAPNGGPSLLALTVTFDLGNNPLQGLLYGLEGSMPALFVDHLSVESPDGTRGDALRVSMTVSGYWRGEGRS